MTFILVDATEKEQLAADSVMELYEMPYTNALLHLPQELDIRFPFVQQSAFLGAERASYRLGSASPVVVVREGLRIAALNELPGTGYPFAMSMFGASYIVQLLDDRPGSSRMAALERALFYYDPAVMQGKDPIWHFLDHQHVCFTKHLYGTIATQEQLDMLGRAPIDIHDIFVPRGGSMPLSMCDEEMQGEHTAYFDEVFLDLAGMLDTQRVARSKTERTPMESPSRGPMPTAARSLADLAGDAEDITLSDDVTLIVDRDTLFTAEEQVLLTRPEGPGVYRKSESELTAVAPEVVRRQSSQTLIGIPAMPRVHDNRARSVPDSSDVEIDAMFQEHD